MIENRKPNLTLVLGVVCIILLVSLIGSCATAQQQKAARQKEIATRMDAEEKMAALQQEKAAVEQTVTALSKTLEELKASSEADKKVLMQEQLVNKSLREELQKLTKLNVALEQDLKEALAKGGKPVAEKAATSSTTTKK